MSLEHLRIAALKERARIELELFGPDDEPDEPVRSNPKKRVRTAPKTFPQGSRRSLRISVDTTLPIDDIQRHSQITLEPKRRSNRTDRILSSEERLQRQQARGAEGGEGEGGGDDDDTQLAPPSPDSSRALLANLDVMKVLFLGQQIPIGYSPTNSCKAAVMYAACGRGPLGNGQPVRFNKYGGAQPFRNAYILFINMFNPNGGNTNEVFGESISWYAPDSSAIDSRLVRSLSNATMRVSLAVRLQKDTEYVYLGDVKFIKVYPGSSPVRIDWKLMDFEELKNSSLFRKVQRAGKA